MYHVIVKKKLYHFALFKKTNKKLQPSILSCFRRFWSPLSCHLLRKQGIEVIYHVILNKNKVLKSFIIALFKKTKCYSPPSCQLSRKQGIKALYQFNVQENKALKLSIILLFWKTMYYKVLKPCPTVRLGANSCSSCCGVTFEHSISGRRTGRRTGW